MWYAASFVGGMFTSFGAIMGAGMYAMKHPDVLAPLSRRMVRSMMNKGLK